MFSEASTAFWHSRIMTEKAVDASEIIAYASTYSGVVATGGGRLNPYKLGIELWRHIKERWDRGQFGEEYDDCDSLREKLRWDRKLGLGTEKMFQVRRIHNDVTFIDEFLTPEFAKEQKMFTFGFNNRRERWEIMSREFEEVKQKLLYQLTNAGNPFILVEDGNFRNRGELLLRHQHEGVDLQADYASSTLENIWAIWGRPVNIATKFDDAWTLLSFDGSGHSRTPFEKRKS